MSAKDRPTVPPWRRASSKTRSAVGLESDTGSTAGFDALFIPDSYRVALQLNDSVKKVLRSAPGWKPPTLLFHFVDSALTLATF